MHNNYSYHFSAHPFYRVRHIYIDNHSSHLEIVICPIVSPLGFKILDVTTFVPVHVTVEIVKMIVTQ